MSLEFKKISGSTPYLLNSASTAEELTLALEDYMRTGAQIIFTHDGEDCLLSSFEYKTGIESTVIAYFVTPKKKLLKVDTAAGFDLVITESEFTPETDTTLTQSGKPADAKAVGDAILIKSESAEIWVNDDGNIVNLTEEGPSQGMTPIFCGIVDEIPDPANMTASDLEIWHFYVVESTGIAYCAINGQLVTIGQLLYDPNSTDYDHGWSTNINAETETGVYCVRKEKIVPIKEYVDNTVANAIGNAIGGSY